MKTIILGGFLGAGKTTFIMQLARYLAGISGQEKKCRVLIVENEIGEVGVDDLMLKSNGYQVNELFAGCACCTMAGELRGTILRIKRELDPEWLLIEATGVAYPRNIKETVDPILSRPGIICALADAGRFQRMLRPAHELVQGQIADASFIFINKINLVDMPQAEEVERLIREINPDAPCYRINALLPLEPEIWAALTGSFEEKGQG